MKGVMKLTRINIIKHYPFSEEYYQLFVDTLFREAIDKEIIRLEHRLENSKYEVEINNEDELYPINVKDGTVRIPVAAPLIYIYFNKSDFSKVSLKILKHFTQDLIGVMWESTPSRVILFDLLYISTKGNYIFKCSSVADIVENDNKLVFVIRPGTAYRSNEIDKMKNKQHDMIDNNIVYSVSV